MQKKRIVVFYSSEAQKGIVTSLKRAKFDVYEYYYGLNLKTTVSRIISKIFRNRQQMIVNQFNKRIDELTHDFLSINPDIVLFMKGHKLNKRSKKQIQNFDCLKIQWTIDSVIRFPGQADLFQFMDKVFLQDGADIKRHSGSTWLPLGFDEKIYKPSQNKTIDILLVGNLKQPFYKSRMDYFFEAAKLADKGYIVEFVGSNLPEKLQKQFKEKKVNINGFLPLNEYALKIATSKICINIHQDDGGQAINPLFFAIPASATIQITNEIEYLNEWLKDGDEYFSCPIEKLNDTIQNKLQGFSLDKQLKKASKLQKHSYSSRIKKIISK